MNCFCGFWVEQLRRHVFPSGYVAALVRCPRVRLTGTPRERKPFVDFVGDDMDEARQHWF